MAVRIRMARLGRTNRPYYRVGAFDSRTRRDGSPIEYLGHFDPLIEDFDASVQIDVDRVRYWLGKGAKVSETVSTFLKRKGVVLPRNARTSGNRSKGKSPGAAAKKGSS